MPTLTRITIYPIKSLDGRDVAEARVLPGGALENDRRWALVDAQGRYVHGKRTPAIHRIRARFDDSWRVTLVHGDASAAFQLPDEAPGVAEWLSDALRSKCRLIENADGGFPDDGAAPGPTLVSTSSLAAVAEWYPGLGLDEMRRRIRANLEIAAAEPFWEDQLADDGLRSPRISVGGVVYRGRTICARCVVPTRDSQSGVVVAEFARTFFGQRKKELPAWSPVEQFDHFYRLAINTSADGIQPDAVVRVGDEVGLA